MRQYKKQLSFLIVLSFFIVSCNKLKGSFAYKNGYEEKYHIINKKLEIQKNKKVNWIYKFKNISKNYKIGVIIQKKETMWVDIYKRVDLIDLEGPVVYGKIENLLVGDYKIVLVDVKNKNELIDRFEFNIYSDEEEGY